MKRIFAAFMLIGLASLSLAGEFTPTGVGGGGWLHSGAFHPESDDIILVGSDITGGIYSTDDFGLSWQPCNQGLFGDDEQDSHYCEDLLGIKNSSFEGFIAATRGGLFHLPYDDTGTKGSWSGATPIDDFYYVPTNGLSGPPWRLVRPFPFACLDSDRNNLVVAGAGRVRWGTSDETGDYPGLPDTALTSSSHSASTDQYSVWKYDFSDSTQTWTPFDTSCKFGSARDITLAVVGTDTCIAVATPDSLMLWSGSSWTDVSDLDFEFEGTTYSDLYPGSLTAWSVHLTPRGTLYAAMQKVGTSLPSGVYRLYDINAADPTWVWVGDDSILSPYSDSLRDIGTYFKDLLYLTVNDGTATAPDTLFLGARSGPHGLQRCTQPYVATAETGTWTNLVWSEWSNGGISEDPGWGDLWGANVIYHPVMSENNPAKLAVQFNGRMHVTADSGDTWLQRYCIESPTDVWTSRGYNELCVLDMALDSAGKLYSSTGDAGLFRSHDDSWQGFEFINPPLNIYASGPSTEVWSTETAGIAVAKYWRSTGKDAVFVHCGDVIQKGRPGKIMMLYDDVWTNVSATVPDLNRYLFGDIALADDETLFAIYIKYTAPVNPQTSRVIAENGVMRFDYDAASGTWSHSFVNLGLGPDVDNRAYGNEIAFNETSGRIFLAARTLNNFPRGSLYYLSSKADSSWSCAFSTADSTTFRDVMSLGQSRHGTKLYIGTRGLSGVGYGTVLKCNDPSATPLVVTPLVNGSSTECYFDFAIPAGLSTYTHYSVNKILTMVTSLVVDPDDADKVYAGLSSNGLARQEGLWLHDGSTWEHLSDGEAFQGMGVACSVIRNTAEKRIAIGTDGQEIYYVAIATGGDDPPPKYPKISLRSSVVPGAEGDLSFSFGLPRAGSVEFKVFDVRGRLVSRRDLGEFAAGPHTVSWNGRNDRGGATAAGVYFAKVISGSDEGVVRFVLIK